MRYRLPEGRKHHIHRSLVRVVYAYLGLPKRTSFGRFCRQKDSLSRPKKSTEVGFRLSDDSAMPCLNHRDDRPSGTGASGSAFAAYRVEIGKTRLGAEKCSFLFTFSCAALFYREYDAQSLRSYALLIIFYTFVCNFCIVTII